MLITENMQSRSCLSLCTMLRLLLLASSVFVFAQNTPGQWVGDLYSTSRPGADLTRPTVLIDEKNYIRLEIPNLATIQDFSVPRSLRMFANPPFWRDDALYTVARTAVVEKDKDGVEFSRASFAKWQDDEWRYSGWLMLPPREGVQAIPCDNDRFIIITSRTDLADNNRANRTPFHLASPPSHSDIQKARLVNFIPGSQEGRWMRVAIMNGTLGGIPLESDITDEEQAKINEQLKIKLLSPIDHGQDDLRKHISDPTWFGLASRSQVVMTDEYAVLVSRETGLYWIFSLKNASLKKTGNIFRKMTPEILAEGDFLRVGGVRTPVICVNPEKDGNVLIAAEDESFFLTEKGDPSKEANEIYRNMPEPKTMQDFAKIFDEKEKELFEKNPYIVWYRLYPENGKVETLSAPPEGGTLLRGDARGAWRPMPDGSVEMGHLSMKIRDVKEEEKVENDGVKRDSTAGVAALPPQINIDLKK